MKNLKKLVALGLTTAMCFTMAMPTFATSTENAAGGTASESTATKTAGKITVTNANAGQTYTAYKIFNATYNEGTKTTSYYIDADTKAAYENLDGFTELFEVKGPDTQGRYTVNAKTENDPQILAWVKANKDAFKNNDTTTATANVGATTLDLDTGYGYFYIVSSDDSTEATITINSANPTQKVIDKHETAPTIPNDYLKRRVDAQGNEISDTSVAIGDDVFFAVDFTATNFETVEGVTKQITEYYVVDEATNMAIDTDSVNVYIDNATNPLTQNYSVITQDDGKVKITIEWDDTDGNPLYNSPVNVHITYKAEVTSGAVNGTATNKATLSYLKKGEDDPTKPDQPDGPDVTLNTYEFTLQKTDENNDDLAGATFNLYKVGGTEENPTYTLIDLVAITETDGEEANVYRLADSEDAASETISVVNVIKAGQATIKGLSNGTYVLEETKAPEGYNKIDGKITNKVIVIKDGNYSNPDDEDGEYIVQNLTGKLLPSTGGMGTTIFYIVGIALVAGAGVVLVTRKRMANQ
jgi:LPXTG-motif cell wall-anchored protein